MKWKGPIDSELACACGLVLLQENDDASSTQMGPTEKTKWHRSKQYAIYPFPLVIVVIIIKYVHKKLLKSMAISSSRGNPAMYDTIAVFQ